MPSLSPCLLYLLASSIALDVSTARPLAHSRVRLCCCVWPARGLHLVHLGHLCGSGCVQVCSRPASGLHLKHLGHLCGSGCVHVCVASSWPTPNTPWTPVWVWRGVCMCVRGQLRAYTQYTLDTCAGLTGVCMCVCVCVRPAWGLHLIHLGHLCGSGGVCVRPAHGLHLKHLGHL